MEYTVRDMLESELDATKHKIQNNVETITKSKTLIFNKEQENIQLTNHVNELNRVLAGGKV